MIAKLPRNLSALTKAAAKQEHYRYAANHIFLSTAPGKYRAEATNGRVLAIIQGCNPVGPQDHITEVLVPQDFWKSMLKAGSGEDVKVVTRDLTTMVVGNGASTITGEYFHTADREGVPFAHVLRWPPIQSILPKTSPQISMSFDPAALKNLLEVAVGLGLSAVSLHWFGAGQNLALTGKNEETGQTFDAVFVPFLQPK